MSHSWSYVGVAEKKNLMGFVQVYRDRFTNRIQPFKPFTICSNKEQKEGAEGPCHLADVPLLDQVGQWALITIESRLPVSGKIVNLKGECRDVDLNGGRLT